MASYRQLENTTHLLLQASPKWPIENNTFASNMIQQHHEIEIEIDIEIRQRSTHLETLTPVSFHSSLQRSVAIREAQAFVQPCADAEQAIRAFIFNRAGAAVVPDVRDTVHRL